MPGVTGLVWEVPSNANGKPRTFIGKEPASNVGPQRRHRHQGLHRDQGPRKRCPPGRCLPRWSRALVRAWSTNFRLAPRWGMEIDILRSARTLSASAISSTSDGLWLNRIALGAGLFS